MDKMHRKLNIRRRIEPLAPKG